MSRARSRSAIRIGHQVMHIGFNAVDPGSPIVSFEKMSITCS